MKTEELRSELKVLLTPERMLHSEGCAEMAAALAAPFGTILLEKACFAGLAHDIARDFPERLIKKFSAIEDGRDIERWKKGALLSHGPLGARHVAANFCFDRAIYKAIFFHTTGCRGMSRLQQILLIADFCEKTRSFKEALLLRREISSTRPSKERLLIWSVQVLKYKLRYLLDEGRRISPLSLQAYNSMLKRIS